MNIVTVHLTNRYATFQPPYPTDELRPFFSFRPPGYQFMPQFRMGGWDGRICLLKRDRVPSGLFRSQRKEIEQALSIRFQAVSALDAVPFRLNAVQSDRSYQNACVERMIGVAQAGGGLVLGATGTGKTYIAGLFFRRLRGYGCFIVDELTLLRQAQEELSRVVGEEIGVVGNQEFNPRRITVATVQTMHLHRADPIFRPWTRQLQAVLIDEIHVAMNRRNFQTVAAIEPPAVYGLTATLELKKPHIRMKAFALAGPVIFEYPLERGVAEGYLAPGVVCQVECENPVAGKRPYAEEYERLVVRNQTRNEAVCMLVREAHRRGKYVVVLVERIAHLELLSEALQDLPHRVACGLKAVEERVSAKRKFEAGKVRILLANKVFKKGVDLPRLDVIIDVAALKSKTDAIQKYGRGVRQCEGKTGLLYFDIADTGEGNRFEKCTRSRRSAFRQRQIPILRNVHSCLPTWEVRLFDKAEQWLERVAKKVVRRS